MMELPEWEDMDEDYDLPVESMARTIPKGFRYTVQPMVDGEVDGINFKKGDIGEVVKAEYNTVSGDRRIWIKFEDGRKVEIGCEFYPMTSDFYLKRCENPDQLNLF